MTKKNGEKSYVERRKSIRIPVSMGFKLNVRGMEPEFFYTTFLLNFSEGGICIQWDYCDECTGYLEGGIHPECIFKGYDYSEPGSKELVFHIELANYEKDINFKGKAVYTWKEGGTEKVGIAFTEISEEMLEFMKKVI